MNVNLKIGLSFLMGSLVGAFAVKKYMDYKTENVETVEELVAYEDLVENDSVEEEIEIKTYNNSVNRVSYAKIKSVDDEEYIRLLDDLKYKQSEKDVKDLEVIFDSNAYPGPSEEDDRDPMLPYNISQEEFDDDEGEYEEYTYFADGYVTDSYGIPLEDKEVVNHLGADFVSYFGTYDDNQIWIRNLRVSMNFSVIRDLNKFEDIADARTKRLAGIPQ